MEPAPNFSLFLNAPIIYPVLGETGQVRATFVFATESRGAGGMIREMLCPPLESAGMLRTAYPPMPLPLSESLWLISSALHLH